MTRGYDIPVSRRQWQIGLFAFALTVIGGAALAIALALGAANPPQAANLVLNLNSADDLTSAGNDEELQLFALPTELAPPFTIEMAASNSGAQGSAWGLWLRTYNHYGNPIDDAMLIDNQGYVLEALPSPQLEHRQFPHILSGDNRLTLHYDESGHVTLRINNEVFATLFFMVSTVGASGLALYGDAQIDWKSIKVYTG